MDTSHFSAWRQKKDVGSGGKDVKSFWQKMPSKLFGFKSDNPESMLLAFNPLKRKVARPSLLETLFSSPKRTVPSRKRSFEHPIAEALMLNPPRKRAKPDLATPRLYSSTSVQKAKSALSPWSGEKNILKLQLSPIRVSPNTVESNSASKTLLTSPLQSNKPDSTPKETAVVDLSREESESSEKESVPVEVNTAARDYPPLNPTEAVEEGEIVEEERVRQWYGESGGDASTASVTSHSRSTSPGELEDSGTGPATKLPMRDKPSPSELLTPKPSSAKKSKAVVPRLGSASTIGTVETATPTSVETATESVVTSTSTVSKEASSVSTGSSIPLRRNRSSPSPDIGITSHSASSSASEAVNSPPSSRSTDKRVGVEKASAKAMKPSGEGFTTTSSIPSASATAQETSPRPNLKLSLEHAKKGRSPDKPVVQKPAPKEVAHTLQKLGRLDPRARSASHEREKPTLNSAKAKKTSRDSKKSVERPKIIPSADKRDTRRLASKQSSKPSQKSSKRDSPTKTARREEEKMQTIERALQNPAKAGLSKKQMKALAQLSSYNNLPPGRTLLRAGPRIRTRTVKLEVGGEPSIAALSRSRPAAKRGSKRVKVEPNSSRKLKDADDEDFVQLKKPKVKVKVEPGQKQLMVPAKKKKADQKKKKSKKSKAKMKETTKAKKVKESRKSIEAELRGQLMNPLPNLDALMGLSSIATLLSIPRVTELADDEYTKNTVTVEQRVRLQSAA